MRARGHWKQRANTATIGTSERGRRGPQTPSRSAPRRCHPRNREDDRFRRTVCGNTKGQRGTRPTEEVKSTRCCPTPTTRPDVASMKTSSDGGSSADREPHVESRHHGLEIRSRRSTGACAGVCGSDADRIDTAGPRAPQRCASHAQEQPHSTGRPTPADLAPFVRGTLCPAALMFAGLQRSDMRRRTIAASTARSSAACW